MTTLSEWDAAWQPVYEKAREDGETPNQAITTADELITAELGERPVES